MNSIIKMGVVNITQNISGLNPVADGDLWTIVTRVVNVVMAVLGTVCVVMLIVGGYAYATSAGDSSKVTKAKNTILYAVIGLVIALLSVVIVNFVLDSIMK